MADAAALLRLLEPAVRPVGRPAEHRSPGPAPFESQTFDNLLANARHSIEHDPPETPDADQPARRPDPLAGLANFAGFENSAVRTMLAEHR